MTDPRFRPGWLQDQVARSVASLARIPRGYGGTAGPRRADDAIRVVREALADRESGPYGDLLLNADRAAVIAVAALRDAGLLHVDNATNSHERGIPE